MVFLQKNQIPMGVLKVSMIFGKLLVYILADFGQETAK